LASSNDKSKKALQVEREWRERLILAARKMQLASQSFSEDISAIRDVRPEMDRLEQALVASQDKLEGLEDRLLAEIMRRLEEKSGHAAATDAQRELAEARDELKSQAEEVQRLAAEQDSLAQMQTVMEAMQAEHEAGTQALKEACEKELADLRDRLRTAELGHSETEAKHQGELQHFADHTQGRIRKLEDEILKKRRGIKALTEENIQLQTQLGNTRKDLEERIDEMTALVSDSQSEDDTRAAIEAQTSADLGESRGPLPEDPMDVESFYDEDN